MARDLLVREVDDQGTDKAGVPGHEVHAAVASATRISLRWGSEVAAWLRAVEL